MQAREERQFAEWLKELKAYRETYPYGVEGYSPRAELSNSEIPNNSTISKMEQVDKDINVRSKDEPQSVKSNLEPFRVDEPQTETQKETQNSNSSFEKQTDCAWK
jgi:hypothetical protein